MRRWSVALACWFALAVQAADDAAILAARDAFAAGDRAKLAQAAPAAAGHVLDSYVEYWRLRLRNGEAPASEITDFLRRREGDWLAERLRGDWLRGLGSNRDWDRFELEYPNLVQPDRDLRCHALHARVARGDAAALDEAMNLWFELVDPPPGCKSLMGRLHAEGRVGTEEIWSRMRLQLEAKRLGPARELAGYLPKGEAPDGKQLDAITSDPERYLKRQGAGFAATRRGREMAMYALQRLARKDPRAAATAFEPLKPRFSARERAYVYGQLGWQAAMRHLPEASAWYRAAGELKLSEEQIAWKARAALRAEDWRLVRDTIDAMPERLASQPVWVYWLARAQRALGHGDTARELFERIGGQPNYYSNLADEELGRPVVVPPKAPAPTKEEMALVRETPGIGRALALFRLDLRLDAIREWNWSLRGRDDRFLLAAAQLARGNEVFDRAIQAADRTVEQHDYSLRYLAPFRDLVEPQARERDLDEAWVYGLMRQESRFVTDARSSAGARGLMQLMPATAKWVARKIGLKDFSLLQVNDMSVNVMLGTSYLKMVLDSLDNHPVLASAAYNAGPGRARRWRDGRPLEGAIYVETIPFDETRDYVRKVMSNALYYDALFNGKAGSLKARLGVVQPAAGNGEDLP